MRQALRVNVQYAKRWNFAQLRFGLFETTGGLASDFYILNDHLQLSLEAFDWYDESPFRKMAHLKTYLNFYLYGQIYGVIGLDDLTRIDYTSHDVIGPRPYLGAGFNFTDDDLKAFLGTAALAR